jgi:hypothetical protein
MNDGCGVGRYKAARFGRRRVGRRHIQRAQLMQIEAVMQIEADA